MKQGTLYASASRTATPTVPAPIHNPGFQALHVVIVATAKTSTPSVVPTIRGYDYLQNPYTILVGDAITDVGTTVLKVGLGISPVSGGAAADMVPPLFDVLMTHGDGDALTYSVTYTLGDKVG